MPRRKAEVGPSSSQQAAAGRGSSWNTTLLDQVVSDFMTAVCGPRAADGECDGGLSVVPQLSTMPAWLYESDGVNRTARMPAQAPGTRVMNFPLTTFWTNTFRTRMYLRTHVDKRRGAGEI